MNACQKEKLSLAVRPGDEVKPPFTEEELLLLGRQYACLEGIAPSLRDDAAQEFAIAGWQAPDEAEHGENIRAFQIQAGKWAVADFLKQENRHCANENRYKRETFHAHNGGTSAENIIDDSAVNPLKALIAKEDGTLAMLLLGELSERERNLVEIIVLEGRKRCEAAKELGLSKVHVTIHGFSKASAGFIR